MAARKHPNKPGAYRICRSNLSPGDQRIPKCECGQCKMCLARANSQRFRERRRLGIRINQPPPQSKVDFKTVYDWDRTGGNKDGWNNDD